MKAQGPRYRHRVTIQRQQAVVNELGEQEISWVDVLANEPAEVLTGPGREFMAAGQMQSDVAARITLRWFPGLDATMRILWDGRVFNIAGDPDTDATGRREWRVKCRAGVNDG